MDKEFWHQRWQTGRIGFHTSQPHWALEKHWPGLQLPETEPVLVPLCGKSLDMHWLRLFGHAVEGVEIDPIAVQAFFDDWRSSGQLETTDTLASNSTAAEGICLWEMNFLDFRPARSFSAFYDRAALIALPPAMRSEYLQHLRGCLKTGAIGLLVALEYEQDHIAGPPFSISTQELKERPDFSVEILERRDILADSPKFLDQGVCSLHETVYRMQAV